MNKNLLVMTLLKMNGYGPAKVIKFLKQNDFDYSKVLKAVENFSKEQFDEFSNAALMAEAEINLNSEKGISLITALDSSFPEKLYSGTGPVAHLYYRGNIELLNEPAIAVIGSREIREPFISQGFELTKKLAERFVIVSGLAAGADTVAHEAALKAGGKTIAVLPSPCDNIQPAFNLKLAYKIVEEGGLLISEYSSGEIFSKATFVQRDRIQSLLSKGILVIKAHDKSGTIHAVKRSQKDNKPVYAIKGNRMKLINDLIEPNNPRDLEKFISEVINFSAKKDEVLEKEPPKKESKDKYQKISMFDLMDESK